MYTPSYLEWLDRTESHSNGWPKFVDKDSQEWATTRVKKILEDADGPLPLPVIADRMLPRHNHDIPECFKKLGLWMRFYGVTHRALLAAECQQLWVAKSPW